MDLLTKSLEPIESYLHQHKDKELSVEKYFLINEEITNHQMYFYTTSSRLNKFLESFRVRFASGFNSIKDVEVWESLSTKYWNVFFKGNDTLHFYTYHLLLEIYASGNKDQKFFIANIVKNEILLWMKNDVNLRVSFKADLITILAENNMFESVKSYFPISKFENNYNIKVINETIKFDIDKAEKMCKSCIASNVNDRYNQDYYEILEKLYEEKGNLAGQAFIKRKRFMYRYTFEDYLFIEKNDADRDEFKKFRNRVLSNLRGSFYSSCEGEDLYFKILDYEKNYKKMIEVLRDDVRSEVICKYADKLFLFDKNKFLNAFRNKMIWRELNAHDIVLAEFLVSKYDSAVLKDFFKNSNSIFGGDKFSQYITKLL